MAKVAPWARLYLDLAAMAQRCAEHGWCPAGSGQFSMRLPHDLMATTAIGSNKFNLSERDFVTLDMEAETHHSVARPAEDALLHAELYKLDSTIGIVAQVHMVAATVLARETYDDFAVVHAMPNLLGDWGERIPLRVIDGAQPLEAVIEELNVSWQIEPLQLGCLLKNRGLVVWGRHCEETFNHLQALEFLFACELAGNQRQ